MATTPGSGLDFSVTGGGGASCSALTARAQGSMCGTGPTGAKAVVLPDVPGVSSVQPPIANPPNCMTVPSGSVSCDVGPGKIVFAPPVDGRMIQSARGIDTPGPLIVPPPRGASRTGGCADPGDPC